MSQNSDPPGDSRHDSNPESESKPPESEGKARPEPDSEARPEVEAKAAPDSDAEPRVEPEDKADSGSEHETRRAPEANPRPKSDAKKPESHPDSQLIGSLAEQFRVIGELRAPPGIHRYAAIRNEDHAEVVIDVFKSDGGVGNDLAHLAADVQLRFTMSHPRVPPILDGRWLDTNTYAFVSDRIKGDTLQERLDRGDRPGTAEVATILNDVKAVLDWARTAGIVHRGVSPDTIIVEQDTNRLLVTLAPTPIPLAGLPGEVADARTLGALAWSLFTGRRFVDDDSRPPLGELCPNLAARVADATERILRARPNDRPPDAAAFIGIVAVGDVLKQAEVEFAALDEEFASHFTGDATRQSPSEAPERLLSGRTPGTRESILALGTIAALVLLIALGVGLAGRSRRSTSPIVAQQMPTVPAAGAVDTSVRPMRNDSILTHSAAGAVAESTARQQDSVLRENAVRDSMLRDSITRDRIGRAQRVRDSIQRDSLDRDNARRDSLDEDAYRRDSIRNAFRAEARRDSERQDSIRRALVQSDSSRIDSLRNEALRQDSIRRDAAKRDSIRRDSVRRDTIPRRPPDSTRPDSVRPDSIRRDTIGFPRPPHGSRRTTG